VIAGFGTGDTFVTRPETGIPGNTRHSHVTIKNNHHHTTTYPSRTRGRKDARGNATDMRTRRANHGHQRCAVILFLLFYFSMAFDRNGVVYNTTPLVFDVFQHERHNEEGAVPLLVVSFST